jgi:hypothetical protein
LGLHIHIHGALTAAQVDVGPAADLPEGFFEHAGAAAPQPPAQQTAAPRVPDGDAAAAAVEEKPGQLPKVCGNLPSKL